MMSRFRYVKGNIIKITGGKHRIFGESIEFISAKRVIMVGDEGGVSYGSNPEKPPVRKGTYIIEGKWTSDKEGQHQITEAKIGDYVYLHIETQNIGDGEFLLVKIHDYDEILYIDIIKEDDYLKIIDGTTDSTAEMLKVMNGKAVQHFQLGEGSKALIKDELDKTIELYAKVTYLTDRNVQVPVGEDSYLKVKPEETTGEIIFQSASNNHPLPMIFDAQTGEPYYFDVKSMLDYGKESYSYIRKMNRIVTPQTLNGLEKKSYEFAIRRLKAGELVFNDGSVGTTKRLYEYTIENLDQTYTNKIVMGVNKGNFVKGGTSRGINQLEAFSSRGKAGVLKFLGKNMPLISSVMDLSSMAVAVGNGEKPPIPFMPPFVTWEVERICKEMDEFTYDLFFHGLNNVLFGNIDHYETGMNAVDDYINKWNYKQQNVPHLKYNWQVVRLTESTLEKLLRNEIEKEEFIANLYEKGDYEVERNCGILVFTNFEKDEYDREIVKHYIYAIFLPEIEEK